MLYKEGTALNFDDLAKQYIKFLQSYNDNTIVWNLVDPRYNTFFGSTFSIPKSDYASNTDDYSGKNIVLFIDDGIKSEYVKDFVTNNVKQNNQYLPSVLTRCFPNANIITVDYSTLFSSSDSGHIDYIANTANNIDKLIVFVNQLQYNITYGDIVKNINDIDAECANRDIDVDYVYAPSIINLAEKDLIGLVGTVPNEINNIITTSNNKRVWSFFDLIYEFDQDVYTDFYNKYTVAGEYGNGICYNQSMSALLTKFVLNRLFRLDREEFYLSLMYQRITTDTYKRFITDYGNHMSEEFSSNGGSTHVLTSKYGGTNYTPFKNTGELISIGLHTSKDYSLFMHEQGGITCKYEEDLQLNDIDLMPFMWFSNGTPDEQSKPLAFPTTGCPWLTVSDENKGNFLIGSENPIHYYFLKDNDNSTIVIRFCDGTAKSADVWQVISFGKFDKVLDKYNINPLYCAGGNQALSPDSWTYYRDSKVAGLLYDLDIKNPALCNSNFLHPTKFGKANLSNFRVLGNDGLWKDVYAHYQEYKVVGYSGDKYHDGTPIDVPQDITDKHFHTAYPFGTNIRNRIDTYQIDASKNYHSTKYNSSRLLSSGQIEPVTIYLYGGDSELYKDIEWSTSGGSRVVRQYAKPYTEQLLASGTVPHAYSTWSRTLPDGIRIINGRKYICIPNGWNERLWHYPWWCGKYWEDVPRNDRDTCGISGDGTENGVIYNEIQRDFFHTQQHLLGTNIIWDKLLIDFGEA